MDKVFAIIWLHFIADFVLQPRFIANNKTNDAKILGLHCFIYGVPLLLIDPLWAGFNAIAHFLIDAITSSATKYFSSKGKWYLFFTTIGLDQAIHLSILIWSYNEGIVMK